jgi:DNA-binding CsgD family transcriptional regulator
MTGEQRKRTGALCVVNEQRKRIGAFSGIFRNLSGVYEMVFNAKQLEYLKKCWHITHRELQVTKLICDGFDNKQIGKKLGISYNTVRAHLGNVFRKVGIKGKASLILRFVEVIQKAGI